MAPQIKQPEDALLHADESVDDFSQLLESVYEELKSIARFHRLNESKNLTLQTTALVHEAYLRLVNSHTVPKPRDKRHMKALTSRIIRRVLIDHARKRKAQKRNPEGALEAMDHAKPIVSALKADLLDLDAALNQLGHRSRRLEKVVELRFFGGLTNDEVAAEFGVSTRTTERDWQKARIYLLDLLDTSGAVK